MCLKVLWLIYALTWGTLHLLTIRLGGNLNDGLISPWYPYDDLPHDDNSFSFGQCIAVILLALPVLILIENYLGKGPTEKIRSCAHSCDTTCAH